MFQRIVNALAEAIEDGRLRAGQTLPTHRALASALGIDLTTVTRAYAEARRQGLTDATVGRGTFVKGQPAGGLRASAMPGIDLSMNLPPQPADADLDGRLARALAEVRAESGLAPYLTYQQPGGTGAERKAAAEWLGGMVADLAGGLTADRLILAPGTQPALFALLLAHAAPGDAILTEKLTYPGFKAAAAALGVALIGVEMDGEGMIPGALDRAARGGTAKIVYLTPTMQNPTTATMSADRRKRIAAVVRKRGLVLIEDDPYTFLAPGLPPISSFVPERSYFAASLSKAIAPGLRTSIVVAPDAAAAARCAALLRAVVQMSSPLMAAIATQWMRDGTAADLIKATRKETAARQTLARDALQGQDAIAHPAGLHVWLGLPNRWPAPRFVAHLGGRGLAVVTADAFATDAAPPNAIRLALGAARNQAQLARALAILAEALGEGATGDVIV